MSAGTSADPFDRDQYGRPLIPDPATGEPVPHQRVSTFAGLIGDKGALADWQAWQAVKGADVLPDAAARVRTSTKTPKALIAELVDAAGGRDAARRGTDRHAIIAAALTGGPIPDMPAEARAELDAILALIAEVGEVTAVEAPVVCDEWRVAGSADLILAAPDGGVAVLDIKTGRHLDPLAVGVQTVAYARGRYWHHGRRGELVAPQRPRLAALWAPQTGAPPALIDLDPAEAKQHADLAAAIRTARKSHRLRSST